MSKTSGVDIRPFPPLLPILLGWISAAVLAPGTSLAGSGGITSANMPNPPANCTGTGCHQAAWPDVFVEISGPTALSANEIALYTMGGSLRSYTYSQTSMCKSSRTAPSSMGGTSGYTIV